MHRKILFYCYIVLWFDIKLIDKHSTRKIKVSRFMVRKMEKEQEEKIYLYNKLINRTKTVEISLSDEK